MHTCLTIYIEKPKGPSILGLKYEIRKYKIFIRSLKIFLYPQEYNQEEKA